MVANLCLNSESFVNSGESLDDIKIRVNELIELENELKEINTRKEKQGLDKDIIYCFNEIYNRYIYNSKPLYLFICDPTIEHDLKKKLIGFIERTKKTDIDINPEAHIYFFKRENSIIYNTVDLDKFYKIRFNRITSSKIFYNRSIIHFPNLTFSEHVNESLSEIESDITNFSEKIIETLTYLNDDIKDKFKEKNNLKATLKQLTSDIELHASEQGKSKDKLFFEFKVSDGSIKTICCDPHVKYNRGAVATVDKEYYRLYFHMGDKDINKGENVLIGHIGKHIE